LPTTVALDNFDERSGNTIEPEIMALSMISGNVQSILLGLGGVALAVVVAAITAVLYQYFTFNSCPPGTRPLPSPTGRLPLVGHRHLVNQVHSHITVLIL